MTALRSIDGEQNDPIRVGFDSYNYGGARNAYAPVPGVEYRKVPRVPFRLIDSSGDRQLDRAFVPLGPTRCDVVHLWNRTAIGPSRWGASFESVYPYVDQRRNNTLLDVLTRRLVSPRCRFLLPISDFAKRSLRQTVGDDVWSEIEHKVQIVPPHHDAPGRTVPPLGPPSSSEDLRLLFVGVTFFGKGGEAVLDVIEKLGEELDLTLTVVSPVSGADYDSTPPPDTDLVGIRRRLTENDRITWLPRVSNERVLALIEQHHACLLPTLADTFGYVVLECMGLGVPTVVSNVQALPSFTGADTGWQIAVPVDDRGVWIGRQPGTAHRTTAYRHAMDLLRSELEGILRSMRDDPEQLAIRGASSRRRLDRQFSTLERGVTMHSIYERACE